MWARLQKDGPVAPDPGDVADSLAWRTWPEACSLIVCGRTWRPALSVGLVVGSVLSAVNQGDALLTGQVDWLLGLRVVANFLIPYVVSSVGLLSAHRVARRSGPGHPGGG